MAEWRLHITRIQAECRAPGCNPAQRRADAQQPATAGVHIAATAKTCRCLHTQAQALAANAPVLADVAQNFHIAVMTARCRPRGFYAPPGRAGVKVAPQVSTSLVFAIGQRLTTAGETAAARFFGGYAQ